MGFGRMAASGLWETNIRGPLGRAAFKIGKMGVGDATKLGASDLDRLAKRGYRRMGYAGGGAGVLGGASYMHHRGSSGRNGLQGRSSGGY